MSCENCEESAYVIDKLAKLLAEITVIVNGPEPPLTSWSYHDLPEKVRALKEAPPAALAVPDAWAEPGAMTDHELLTDFVRMCRESKPVGQWPGERVCAAIERSMAREAPFQFISKADRSPERNPSHKDSDRQFSGYSKTAAAVPEGGLRDSVLNSAKFRASCYALVEIVEGIAGLGRRWASDGERLKDTPEWVAFYNSVSAMRNGIAEPTSATQAPPATSVSDAEQIERDFLRLIDQRDEREEVINDILDLVLGEDREEWSSAYGFRDAVNDVDERMAALEKQAPPAAVPAGYVTVQLADLAALEATDFGRCGWSVRADLAARRLRDGLLAAALAAKEGE